ncbi:MAG: hypothetical protein QM757_13625 [Paludibaculum sp.]
MPRGPVVADGQAELIGFAGGLAEQAETRAPRRSHDFLAQAGVDETALIEDVVDAGPD